MNVLRPLKIATNVMSEKTPKLSVVAPLNAQLLQRKTPVVKEIKVAVSGDLQVIHKRQRHPLHSAGT